ncbi:hypothetical protein PMIN06_011289 [Paraphaeosphaeria minitans]
MCLDSAATSMRQPLVRDAFVRPAPQLHWSSLSGLGPCTARPCRVPLGCCTLLTRLAQVSRRWYRLLRSTDLLKPALRTWYDNTVPLENATYEDCLRRTHAVHRFRTGRPIEVAAWEPALESPKRIALSEDFFIHVPYPHRQVRLTNLRTGEDWRMATEGRELIDRVYASSELIAFWSQAQTCYIFDYSAKQRAKLRLPPSMNKLRAVQERTFICGGVLNQHIELYLWDLDSHQGRTLRLDQPPFDSAITSPQCLDMQLLPNPRSRTFTLFSTDTCEARWCGHQVDSMSIDYYVITFDGQLVQQNRFVIPLTAEVTEFAGASITSIHPIDRKGSYRISVFCRYNHNGCTHMFNFDENLQTFSLPEQETRSAEDVRTAWWKDSFYQIHVRETVQTKSMSFHLDHIGISGQDSKRRPCFQDSALLDDMDGGTDMALVLNDRFAVVQAFKRLYVFSFAVQAKTADVGSGLEKERKGGHGLWRVTKDTS